MQTPLSPEPEVAERDVLKADPTKSGSAGTLTWAASAEAVSFQSMHLLLIGPTQCDDFGFIHLRCW